MTLIALLVALILERLATRLLHLREAGWLEAYARWAAVLAARRPRPLAIATCFVLVILPVLPVAALAAFLAQAAPGPAWLVFASIVLVFSLGPRDLAEEVDEYLEREKAGDAEGAGRAAAVIIEHDAAQRRDIRARAVEDAVFVQANNRIFGVLFWFVLLGPAGLGPAAAWLFRVSDHMRRESIALAAVPAEGAGTNCPERLHFLLAWAPARLLALSYALAGSFEEARRGWRDRYGELPERLLERNDRLLMLVGRGALGRGPGAESGGPVESAMRLVRRALLMWLTVIALLSLSAWIV